MTFESIKEMATQTIGKIVLGAKEYAPELTLVAGGALIIAGGVLACKQTLKLDEVVQKGEDKMEEIQAAVEEEVELKDGSTYSEEDAKHDRQVTTIHTAVQIGKLYALPVGLGVLGFALIICGHKILRDRNTALLGAYSALATAYGAYRKRVEDRLGAEEEYDIYLGKKVIDEEVEVTNPETGTKEVVIAPQIHHDYPLGSPWARVFNADHTDQYEKADNAGQSYNTTWLKSVQAEAQRKLNTYGTLAINEVYDTLGFPRVPEGQTFGWIKGDTVDFGIYTSWTDPKFKDLWENEFQRTIILDFNVNPEPIVNYIKRGKPNDLDDMDPISLELWSQQNK